MADIPELLERFRRGAELVAVAITGAAGSELDFTPQPGKWSIRQIVCHLADAEIVATMRFRRVIAEDNPTLEAYDGDAWATRLDYARRRPSQALETFRRIRAENFDLLSALPPQAFERAGVHSADGPMTLRKLLEGYAEHAETHAAQLRTRRAEFKAAKAAS